MDDLRFVIGVDDKDLIRSQKEQKKFERNILTIESAFRKNQITFSRYTSELNKQASSLAKLGGTYKQANSEVRTYAASVRKLTDDQLRLTKAQMTSNKVMGNTKNKMNGSNMAIQQLGYQFGDFAVQVQGGTSAFVAFSQQGSQLAGILPMIAGPLGLSMGAAVGLSAALGILIPIGSAVGRMFMESGTEAATLKEALEDLKSAMGDIDSAVDKLNSLNSNGNLTSASLAMISIAESSKAIAEAQFDSSITSFIGKLDVANTKAQTLGGFLTQFGAMLINPLDPKAFNQFDEKVYNKAFDKLGLSVNKSIFEGARDGLEEALYAGTTKEQLKALEKFRDVLVPTVAIPPSEDGEEGRITKSLPTEKAGLEVLKNTNDLINLLSTQVSKEQTLVDIENNKLSFIKQQNSALQNTLSLNNLQDKYGKDSLKYLFAKDKITLAAYKVELENKKLSKEQIANLLEEKSQSLDVLSIRTNSLHIKKEQDKLDKASQIEEDKKNQKAKTLLATQEAILDRVKQQGIVAVSTYAVNGRELFKAQQSLDLMILKDQLKKAGLQIDDKIYQAAVKELNSTHALLTLKYDRVQAEKLITEQIKDRAKLQDKINKTVAKATADAEKEQKKLADSIANSFGSAFMSIVDGTESAKDAFRSMARDIIKQLYQILVVEQMVQSISGAIQGFMSPSGLGNVKGAPQLRPLSLDGGGYTGSGSRSGGLDGKGGFMAMLHPKETIIDHTKSKSSQGSSDSGSVVINQSFNFSANGDDSVKRIIAQAAPKIAQMTKSEIINDRKRGGSMKAAFG